MARSRTEPAWTNERLDARIGDEAPLPLRVRPTARPRLWRPRRAKLHRLSQSRTTSSMQDAFTGLLLAVL